MKFGYPIPDMETDPHPNLPSLPFARPPLFPARSGGGVGIRPARLTVIGLSLLLLLLPMPFSIALADEGNRSDPYSLFEGVAAEPDPSTLDAAPVRTEPAPDPCLFCPDYGKLLLQDVRHISTSPTRWDRRDWKTLALGTLAVAATAALLDKPVHVASQRDRNTARDRAAKILEPFGFYYSFGVLGGFYLAGIAFDDSRAKNVTQDGISASLIAAGIITPALKFSIGRSRPRQDEGTYTFRPFSGNVSFPSGHTTEAFAVASVIAAHYDSLWVQTTAYGVATLVGLSLIDQNDHFASDVVAGALIGSVVGNAVVRFNAQKRTRFQFQPYLDRDIHGVAIVFAY
jgi:membrane-associated phospholipid phosphatase